MATTQAVVTSRSKTATGVTILAGKTDPTATTVTVRAGLKSVHAAIATYTEDPGDVRPVYAGTMTGDSVVFTGASGKEITWVIIGAD